MNAPVLVCFAVPQEAKPFRQLVRDRRDVRILVTGMGTQNASREVSQVLRELRPHIVFTCGFAGALNPTLKTGEVVFNTIDDALRLQLLSAGAKPAEFFSSGRVITTIAEKKHCRDETGCDAVEMESAAIFNLCYKAEIRCATVRSVSDTADENLPLDFNAVMTRDKKLNSLKLAFSILKTPHRIPALMRLGRNSALAAKQLARVLVQVI